MATAIQFFNADSLEEYKTLLETEGIDGPYHNAYCLVKEDGINRLYFGGEPLSVRVTQSELKEKDLDPNDPNYEEKLNSLKRFVEKLYTFNLPTEDGVKEFAIKGAYLPQIGDVKEFFRTVIQTQESIDKNEATYSDGLMGAMDKYRLDVIWKKLNGEIHDEYFTYAPHYLDITRKVYEEGVKAGGLDMDSMPKQIIPLTKNENGTYSYHVDASVLYNVDLAGPDEIYLDIPVEEKDVVVPADQVFVGAVTADIDDVQKPYYDLEDVNPDTKLVRSHGGLPAGMTAQEVKDECVTISGVLNAILYDKPTFRKVSDVSAHLVSDNGFDPADIVPGSRYPEADQMRVEFQSEVWELQYIDGTPVLNENGKPIRVDVYEIVDQLEYIFDGEHAIHPRHWHDGDGSEDESELRYNPPYLLTDPEYDKHTAKTLVKENDRCVYFGIAKYKRVSDASLSVEGPNGTIYTVPADKIALDDSEESFAYIYTENAWAFGDYYKGEIWNTDEDGKEYLEDTSAYWRPNPASPEDCEKDLDYRLDASIIYKDGKVDTEDYHFFNMKSFETFSPIWANVNLEDVSTVSLYAEKNVEPAEYKQFVYDVSRNPNSLNPDEILETVVTGLTDTGIYVSDGLHFYIKWPSGTVDVDGVLTEDNINNSDNFVICVPRGFHIKPIAVDNENVQYVGTAHDTYDDKFTIPTAITEFDSNVKIGLSGNDWDTYEYYVASNYKMYVIEKIAGITTAAITVVKD